MGGSCSETVLAAALPRRGETLSLRERRLSGQASRVPWAGAADRLLVPVGGQWTMVGRSAGGVAVSPGANLAGEPRDNGRFEAVPVPKPSAGPPPEWLAGRAGLLRVAGMTGRWNGVAALTAAYVAARRQFGRPLAAFQAVGHAVAMIVGEREQGRAALAAAVAAIAADPEARALVVAGAGRAFCAGADLPAVFGGPVRPCRRSGAACRRCTAASWTSRSCRSRPSPRWPGRRSGPG